MDSKKAKKLMISTCVQVNEMGEVSWINSISIAGNGSTLVHSDYLGDYKESAQSIANKSDCLNLPKMDVIEVPR